MIRWSVSFIIILIGSATLSAQIKAKKVKKYLLTENYNALESLYAQALNSDPNNYELNMKMGEIMLKQKNPEGAVNYFKSATQIKSDSKEAWKELVFATALNHDFKAAMDLLNRAPLKEMKFKDEGLRKLMSSCVIGQNMIQHPANARINNLGARVNSSYQDVIPFIAANDSILIFCTNRRGVKGSRMDNGKYPYEIMMISRYEQGWSQPRPIKELASPLNEMLIGASVDLDQLVLLIGKKGGVGQVMAYKLDNGKYVPTTSLNDLFKRVNDIGGITISEDGQKMIFSAEMKNGFGGKDLYQSNLLPNGEWAQPLNLGKNINTKGDEEHPSLAQYGKFLYFSSNGHPGAGRKDLFKSKVNHELQWKKPLNLGFPINTAFDDHLVTVDASGDNGYFSRYEYGGIGKEDIYHFKISKEALRPAVYMVYLKKNDKALTDNIVLVRNRSGEDIGTYTGNAQTERYILALHPGEYEIFHLVNDEEQFIKKIVVGPQNVNKFANEIFIDL